MKRVGEKGIDLSISASLQSAVQCDYDRFAEQGLPPSLEGYLLDAYGLDVSAEYAGFPLKNPWSKASGQLSMTARQVAEDVAAGLGFVVLKTVIAQDQSGEQSMAAWAIPETRMVAERIVGHSGEPGWSITWKGRGWWQSFEAYLQLIRDARRLAAGTDTLIVPSCKYHLPSPAEPDWRVDEYDYTTRKMLEAWQFVVPPLGGDQIPPEGGTTNMMPLEKDFSPTLAGSDRAATQSKIIEWLRVVPRLVRDSADGSGLGDVRIGLKMFNALFDDDFQLEMLKAIHEAVADRPDFFVYANRLFDPQREFDGQRGVAFGGPDLSDRNLRVVDRFLAARQRGEVAGTPISWSATGNITTGRMAIEYALRGATSFQLHTFFQLPSDQYSMKTGTRTQRALHELYFHPQTGFIVCLFDVANRMGLSTKPLRFLDVARTFANSRRTSDTPRGHK
jgi:hypothetical protein